MREWEDSYYINRTLCSVLEDMRKCSQTMNFSPLLSLIEEAQILGNRMEAALTDQKDIKTMHEERSKLKAEIMKLRLEKKSLKPEPV